MCSWRQSAELRITLGAANDSGSIVRAGNDIAVFTRASV